eukprot:958662-Lingulodinium_polyedra.AAC.1
MWVSHCGSQPPGCPLVSERTRHATGRALIGDRGLVQVRTHSFGHALLRLTLREGGRRPVYSSF